MNVDKKVFSSDIKRGQKPLQNDLYDLLNIHTVKPSIIEIDTTNSVCDFKPKDKLYVPKKGLRLSKVKTVRQVRNEYATFVNTYLDEEVTKMEKFLFNKIRNGSVTNAKTINLVTKILKNDQPISRSAWQMLTNMNPNKNINPIQYVFWNGKKIRVTGSFGGDKKFLCNFDLEKKKLTGKKPFFKKHINQKHSLLKTSLAVDFKPGPLSKKTELDKSYQNKHVGATKLVSLPKIGLDVEPSIGVPVEPTISNILHTFREEDGKITNNWALFAVSTLAYVENAKVLQSNKDAITFDLNFKNHQNKILMRHDEIKDLSLSHVKKYKLNDKITADKDTVKTIVNEMIRAVEISLIQDELIMEIDSNPINSDDIEPKKSPVLLKEKQRNKFSELQKLDVTVIRVSESIDSKQGFSCKNGFCRLGCICNSLETRYNFKKHCGRLDCMFECKCDFSKYKAFSALNSQCADLVPGLISYDDKINSKLAKEEKKFHQTVVVTDDNSIVLKAQKRNLKTPKRYAQYFNNASSKNEYDKKYLSVSATKLDSSNVEIWCMVHNLYRCFCKGRFIECLSKEPVNVIDTTATEVTPEEESSVVKDNSVDINSEAKNKNLSRSYNEDSMKLRDRISKSSSAKRSSVEESDVDYSPNRCSRTIPFKKRKLNDSYYFETNRKIKELEQNDKSLHQKLMSYIKINEATDESIVTNEIGENILRSTPTIDLTDAVIKDQGSDFKNCAPKYFENKNKLVIWFEANYKKYKERLEKGHNKFILEAPKPGKFALYPWEVILDRYHKRKNYFMVTKEEPYRIFIAVDANKPFFKNCINVCSIRIEDVKKYPVTVKNLHGMYPIHKDNFYIMCGMQECWELIGLVTKMKEKDKTDRPITPSPSLSSLSQMNIIAEPQTVYTELNNEYPDSAVNYSKWFAMIVEDDFEEVQFHSRGFFVKHANIIKAIGVARASGTTVRLSSQKIENTFPRFGIYALPSLDEIRVYVGPYNKDDVLGIDTVKSTSSRLNKNESRGVWMIIETIENVKLIDEPLSYLPDIDNSSELIILNKESRLNEQSSSSLIKSPNREEHNKDAEVPSNSGKVLKTLKPIKISRKRTFSSCQILSLLKSPIKTLNDNFISTDSILVDQALNSDTNSIPVIKDIFSLSSSINANSSPEATKIRPIAEIAPQVKENTTPVDAPTDKSKLGGMFVLKPEEINKRLSQNIVFANETKQEINEKQSSEHNTDEAFDMDIENFLAISEICSAPNTADVYEVSDDDEMMINREPQDVWIECVNIDSLGYIHGKRNFENKLSFEFPGFKFTDYYDEEEAFNKINQVLSRKVYVPKQINVQWQVVDSKDNIKNKILLNSGCMGPNFILTKRGLKYKPKTIPLKVKGEIPQTSTQEVKDVKENKNNSEEMITKSSD